MKIYIVILIIVVTGLLKADDNKTIDSTNNEGDCLFHWADNNDYTEPDSLSFTVLNKHFVFKGDGKFRIIDQNKTYEKLNLKIEKYFFIVNMRYAFCNNKIILVYGISDNDVGSGEVVLIDTAGYINWRVHIPGFNIGFPIINNNKLYLTCIGWVGKLDLTTHKYDWQVGDVYQKSGEYNSFNKPYVKDNKVFFPESTYKKREPLLLIVDDETGEVISGIPELIK